MFLINSSSKHLRVGCYSILASCFSTHTLTNLEGVYSATALVYFHDASFLCYVQIAILFRRQVESIGLWRSVREIARLYEACMGMFIFIPIALLSWFPFFSTFQTRLVFNQAFSRGLEISLILAGNRANTST